MLTISKTKLSTLSEISKRFIIINIINTKYKYTYIYIYIYIYVCVNMYKRNTFNYI